jgi:starch synthase
MAALGLSAADKDPARKGARKAKTATKVVHQWDYLLGEPARLLSASLGGYPLLVLDVPALFHREGGPYGDPLGRDWADNWHRFAALGRAAADIAGGAVKGLSFDLLHAHDWQAGMAPAYLRFAPAAGGRYVPSVMTIHNMAFQGHFRREIFHRLELPQAAWAIDGVEYHGGVGMLKAGLEAASAITTVSRTPWKSVSPHSAWGWKG